jgi:hypothetical protein
MSKQFYSGLNLKKSIRQQDRRLSDSSEGKKSNGLLDGIL